MPATFIRIQDQDSIWRIDNPAERAELRALLPKNGQWYEVDEYDPRRAPKFKMTFQYDWPKIPKPVKTCLINLPNDAEARCPLHFTPTLIAMLQITPIRVTDNSATRKVASWVDRCTLAARNIYKSASASPANPIPMGAGHALDRRPDIRPEPGSPAAEAARVAALTEAQANLFALQNCIGYTGTRTKFPTFYFQIFLSDIFAPLRPDGSSSIEGYRARITQRHERLSAVGRHVPQYFCDGEYAYAPITGSIRSILLELQYSWAHTHEVVMHYSRHAFTSVHPSELEGYRAEVEYCIMRHRYTAGTQRMLDQIQRYDDEGWFV